MKRFSAAALLLAMTALPVGAYAQGAPAGADVKAVRGTVSAVTVYRGQALVTRVVDLPATTGLQEIVVSELPERLQPTSLFAESGDGVEVRSVSYRERPVEKDVRTEVQALDEDIKKLNDALTANAKQQQLLGEQRAYLDKLSNFAAPTANVEMTKGVLNAEQLKNLTTFQFEQRAQVAQKELDLANAARDLQEKINLKNRQRSEITGNSSRTLREAVVFANLEKGGGRLRLRYLVDGATWMPSYNIRADADRKNAVAEYQASIQQMSGEDWTNVKMTLSTATPSLVAAAPLLNPLTISLAARGADPTAAAAGAVDYREAKKALSEQRAQLEWDRNTAVNGDNFANQYDGPAGGGRGRQGGVSGPGGATVSGFMNANNNISNGGTLTITNNAGATTFSSGSLTIINPNDDKLNKLADQVQVLELVARETRKDEELHRSKGSSSRTTSRTPRACRAGRTASSSRSSRSRSRASSTSSPCRC